MINSLTKNIASKSVLVILSAFIFNQEAIAQKDNKVFSFSGSLESFTKAGFNKQSINTTTGAYPTESFATIFGTFNTKYNMLNVIKSDFITKFQFGLGVAAAGLIWDSTLNDIRNNPFNQFSGLATGSGLNNNYIGAYFGPNSKGKSSDGPYYDNRLFMVQNAYIDLKTKYVNIKAGRYESDMDYYSGFVQGFNIDTHFGYGDRETNPSNKIKVWWFSGFGRAFAYSEWFLDYYFPKITIINGRHVNYGIHSVGVDINYGTKADDEETMDIKEDKGYKLMVRPFLWFYPELYEAPGAKIVYENYSDNGYGIKTTLQGYVLHVHNKSDKFTDGAGGSRYEQFVNKWSQNLNLIVQVFMHNYNVRIGFYKNFGSANSHIGTYGNPMDLDYWTASVYDIGPSINDIISRNSTSGYLSGGGKYDTRFGVFSWDILARITRSPRSDEDSIAIDLTHSFKNNISLRFKIEWLRDTTKAGFNPGFSINGNPLTANRTDDRSHVFVEFAYLF